MKKRIIAVAVMTMLLCLALTGMAYAESKTIVLKIGDPNMTVNGASQEIDTGRGTKPVVIQGRTCLPIRAVIEAIGGTITWEETTQTITMTANNKMIKMTLGVGKAEVKEMNTQADWVSKKLDVAPRTINGRTFVPLRFVGETLGATVGWVEATQTVTLTFASAGFDPNSFAGAWDSDSGVVTFQQSGNNISTVANTPYWGKITGTVSGKTFTGRWYQSVESQGNITGTLSADGKTIIGHWNDDSPLNPFVPDPESTEPFAGWQGWSAQRS